MSSFERKLKRSIIKLSQQLFKKLTRPDELCDECEIPLKISKLSPDDKIRPDQDVHGDQVVDACYMTCGELYRRNCERYKADMDKLRTMTGNDERLNTPSGLSKLGGDEASE